MFPYWIRTLTTPGQGLLVPRCCSHLNTTDIYDGRFPGNRDVYAKESVEQQMVRLGYRRSSVLQIRSKVFSPISLTERATLKAGKELIRWPNLANETLQQLTACQSPNCRCPEGPPFESRRTGVRFLVTDLPTTDCF